jgi:hypothetical protein
MRIYNEAASPGLRQSKRRVANKEVHVRFRLSAMLLLALPAVAFAQGAAGTIAGRVTDPNGAVVTIGSVTAKNAATQAVYNAAVSTQGEYALRQLPPGTYELAFASAGNAYSPYVKKDVAVQAGQAVRVDIQTQWGAILGTLGDDPVGLLNAVRARNVPTGPTPRTLDGKPDLSGIWVNIPPEKVPPMPLLPWAAAIEKERTENGRRDSPQSRCLPGNPIQVLANFPYKFVQSPSLIVLLEDFDVPGVHQIFLDGRGHPKASEWNPAWLGHSIGKWEGDTLVVDTVGFNDQGWLGNAPHTEQLHVTERIRRPDAGHLEVEIVAEDPGAFTGVWKRSISATLAEKGEEILEYVCNENNLDVQHLVGAK